MIAENQLKAIKGVSFFIPCQKIRDFFLISKKGLFFINLNKN